jgi:hypothetical protein
MATIFKYLNKLYQCHSLKKKLKRLKIDESDIEILMDNIPEDELERHFILLNNNEQTEEDEEPVKLYHFINNDTGYTITSINPEIPPGYEFVK